MTLLTLGLRLFMKAEKEKFVLFSLSASKILLVFTMWEFTFSWPFLNWISYFQIFLECYLFLDIEVRGIIV